MHQLSADPEAGKPETMQTEWPSPHLCWWPHDQRPPPLSVLPLRRSASTPSPDNRLLPVPFRMPICQTHKVLHKWPRSFCLLHKISGSLRPYQHDCPDWLSLACRPAKPEDPARRSTTVRPSISSRPSARNTTAFSILPHPLSILHLVQRIMEPLCCQLRRNRQKPRDT